MTALLILFFTALVALFAGLSKNRSLLQPITLVGCLLALGSILVGVPAGWNDLYPTMFRFDGFALAFSGVAILSTALIIALSGWGFRKLHDTLGDNYGLILFSVCGALFVYAGN